MTGRYFVETQARNVWAVVRSKTESRPQQCVHMTGSDLEAKRMAEELNKADELAFREGLIIGHDENAKRPPAGLKG